MSHIRGLIYDPLKENVTVYLQTNLRMCPWSISDVRPT